LDYLELKLDDLTIAVWSTGQSNYIILNHSNLVKLIVPTLKPAVNSLNKWSRT